MTDSTFAAAQEYLLESDLAGWLLRDYQGANPIFWNVLGERPANITRSCWLFIGRGEAPVLLVHEVDAGRFPAGGPEIRTFASRKAMVAQLSGLLPAGQRIAMEYSPEGALPRVGRVDAGTMELVRSLGVEVVSSGDVLQYATERWSPDQLASHRYAVEALTKIVKDAFKFVGDNINWKLTEHDVAEFIRGRFDRAGLVTGDGPVVATAANSSDPHYEPRPGSAAVIRKRSWLLIDLWARQPQDEAIFADITWTAFVGDAPSDVHNRIFRTVITARDAAFDFMAREIEAGRPPQGWQMDRVARDVIEKAGYAERFVHRLGHSLGREVHSNGVNLDDWETHDTRSLIQGLGVTIEPGIYLPEFGVRSEIDVFIGPDGPEITGEAQQEIVRMAV